MRKIRPSPHLETTLDSRPHASQSPNHTEHQPVVSTSCDTSTHHKVPGQYCRRQQTRSKTHLRHRLEYTDFDHTCTQVGLSAAHAPEQSITEAHAFGHILLCKEATQIELSHRVRNLHANREHTQVKQITTRLCTQHVQAS